MKPFTFYEDRRTPKMLTLKLKPLLILFSMDSFRAEYLQTWSFLLPNIEKLGKFDRALLCGVWLVIF